jgi:hypothetical protein
MTLKDYPETEEGLLITNKIAAMPYRLKFPKRRDLSSFREIVEY